jgi:hypothetical protein
MLDASRPPERIAGLTVFHDHADDTRRYVLADAPRLVADPLPRLSLVLFRGNATGGLLDFEAMLAPTTGQLAKAAQELTAKGRRPTLARPDWRAGSVRLAGWLAADELAPKVLAVGVPSLVGDPSILVSARLDASGAALAEAALRGNSLPTVVIFVLEMLGLAGPLGVEVEADLTALHDRLTAEGALTTPYGRARIAMTWEKAARDNLIRVRVLDESGDVESQRAEAMRRVGDDLVARMFSPYPPPEVPPLLDDGTVAPLELSFKLTSRREELATHSRWDFRERRAVAQTHYAAASLVDLLGSHPASAHIRFVDLAEARHEIVVRAEPELAKLGLTALEVDVHVDRQAPPAHSTTLTDAKPEARFVDDGPAQPLSYRVRARFDPLKTRAQNRQSDWLASETSLVAVSPRRLFPPRVFTVIAGRVEFDWLDLVEVKVEAPEELPRLLQLSGNLRSADAYFPSAGGHALKVTATWRGLPDEPTRSDAPRTVEDDILILDSPFADSINVLAVPLPRADVATAAVELSTSHDGFVHTKSVSWELPDRTPARIGLRRLAGSPRTYSYRTQFVHHDGTIDRTGWRQSSSETLVVGADGPFRVIASDVVLLGGGPVARHCLGVELELKCGDDVARDILEGERDSATLVLVTRPDCGDPVLTAREFLDSGEIRETHWNKPDRLTVLPAVPA